MRAVGLLLIAIGFLGGALFAVLDPEEIPWRFFSQFLVVGAVGVALVQLAIKREASYGGKLEANVEELAKALDRIVDRARKLDQDKLSIDCYDLPDLIDDTFRGDVTAFVDVRESLVHTFGTQTYGEIMSHFAAGERYMNRVWSASADGYIDEAHEYIGRSREQFEEALRRLERVRSTTS